MDKPEIAAILPPIMGRVLAIDPGEKRVGLALSDPLKILASPYDTLPFVSMKELVLKIKELIAEKDVETVVIGFPVREDDEEGPGCEFARKICNMLKGDGYNALLWDERYTSRLAQEVLRESGVRTRNMKGKIDRIAASYILESYLSSLS